MKRQAFNFELPPRLIAQFPTEERTASKLLHYCRETQETNHRLFRDIIDLIRPGDLLVMNNTKVLPARMFGHKMTGGKLELLVERVLGEQEFACHIKASKALKSGDIFWVTKEDAQCQLKMVGRRDELFVCQLQTQGNVFDVFEQFGHMPLPPYIDRAALKADESRYQTVFAKELGAVAAPTAGLHFDETLLSSLTYKGVNQATLTLHVGAGTFQSMRVDEIEKHTMHSEWISVSNELVESIQQTKANGGRVIAVGTTVVRALETAALSGELQAFEGETDIFLYPGKPFRVIDGMVTNFHLPESTLLMLVSAFIGREQALSMYQLAIEHNYRFFSYGDACLLL